MKIAAIALNTFREAIRNKILYSVIFFGFILIGVSVFFGAVSIIDQVRVIKDFGLFALSVCGAVSAILAGVSLLNKELKQKTIYNILSKPVSRWEFVLGKYIGLSLSVGVLISFMGASLIAFVAVFEGRLDWLLFQSILFILLETSVVAAVTIFFSSLVVTTNLSGMFTLGTYLAGRSIEYLEFFNSGNHGSKLLSGIIRALEWILPNLSLLNVHDSIVYGYAISFTYLAAAVLYSLAYSAAALILAIAIFNKRELT